MGRRAFERTQRRLAWATVGALAAWLAYYGFVVPAAYFDVTGNTRRLIRAETAYDTYLAYVYGEHALAATALTLLPVALALAWGYRAHADDWRCLYG